MPKLSGGNYSLSSSSSGHLLSRILVSIDQSENAKRALKAGIGLALQMHSDLLILNVVQIDRYGIQFGRMTEKDAQQLVDRAVFSARDRGLPVKGIVKRAEVSTVEAIIKCAEEEKADLIVVGTRGVGGFKKLLLGSVSSGVVTHAPCNVLVAR
jgi:nucleotide-binding universal stress UspA family protein